MKRLDLTGQRFGRLIALEFVGRQSNDSQWLCICDCGSYTKANLGHLKSGATKSCGCLRKEITAETKTKHGALKNKQQPPEYKAYIQAMMRCRNPKNARYRRYGERGIEFRFASFEEFYAVLGDRPTPGHSLDRINNEGHYEAGNVRWATRIQQANNKSNNKRKLPVEVSQP